MHDPYPKGIQLAFPLKREKREAEGISIAAGDVPCCSRVVNSVDPEWPLYHFPPHNRLKTASGVVSVLRASIFRTMKHLAHTFEKFFKEPRTVVRFPQQLQNG